MSEIERRTISPLPLNFQLFNSTGMEILYFILIYYYKQLFPTIVIDGWVVSSYFGGWCLVLWAIEEEGPSKLSPRQNSQLSWPKFSWRQGKHQTSPKSNTISLVETVVCVKTLNFHDQNFHEDKENTKPLQNWLCYWQHLTKADIG